MFFRKASPQTEGRRHTDLLIKTSPDRDRSLPRRSRPKRPRRFQVSRSGPRSRLPIGTAHAETVGSSGPGFRSTTARPQLNFAPSRAYIPTGPATGAAHAPAPAHPRFGRSAVSACVPLRRPSCGCTPLSRASESVVSLSGEQRKPALRWFAWRARARVRRLYGSVC